MSLCYFFLFFFKGMELNFPKPHGTGMDGSQQKKRRSFGHGPERGRGSHCSGSP